MATAFDSRTSPSREARRRHGSMSDQVQALVDAWGLPQYADDGDCIPVSNRLAAALPGARAVDVVGWHTFMGQKVLAFAHRAVMLDGKVIDATATQFNRSLPMPWIATPEEYTTRLAQAAGVESVEVDRKWAVGTRLKVATSEGFWDGWTIDGQPYLPGQWMEVRGLHIFDDDAPFACRRVVGPIGDGFGWEVYVPIGFGPNSGKRLSGTAKTLDAAKEKALAATRKDDEANARYEERQRQLLGSLHSSATSLYRGIRAEVSLSKIVSDGLDSAVQDAIAASSMQVGIGVHWTSSRDVAERFARMSGAVGGYGDRGGLHLREVNSGLVVTIPVVLQGRPRQSDLLDDPEKARGVMYLVMHDSDEDEVPVKYGSPIPVDRAFVGAPSDQHFFARQHNRYQRTKTFDPIVESWEWRTVNVAMTMTAEQKVAWGEDHAFTIVSNTDMSAQKFVRWLAPDSNSAWVQPDGTITACYTHAHVGDVATLLDRGWVRMDVMPTAGTVFVQSVRPLTEDQIQSVRVCVLQSGASRMETSTGLGDDFNLREHPVTSPSAVTSALRDFTAISLTAMAAGPVVQLGTPRLKYDYAGQVQRIGIIDPSAQPPKPGWTYFTHEPVEDWRSRRKREEWEAGNGTTKRKPAPKFQEGSGTADEGTVAFLDYIERNDEIFIAYMSVRNDHRRQGLAKKLVDWIYDLARRTGKARVNWGQVFYPANQLYWQYVDRNMGVETTGKPLDGRNAALGGRKLWWRVHPAYRDFSPEAANSTPIYNTFNEPSVRGFSAVANPWHLWVYCANMGWVAEDGPSKVWNDDVIAFTGEMIQPKDGWDRGSYGADGEPLVIPDMRIVQRFSWDEFQRELLQTPYPKGPMGGRAYEGEDAIRNGRWTWEEFAKGILDGKRQGRWKDGDRSAVVANHIIKDWLGVSALASKSDGLGVQWYVPGKKRPIATSTVATSDLISMLAGDGMTFSEAVAAILYDDEAKAIVQKYVDLGYGESRMADFGVRTASKTDDGLGDCYEAAARYMLHDLPEAEENRYRLCHGIVTGQGPKVRGLRFGHAWVEYTESGITFVIDHSNGLNYTGLRDDYYQVGHIDPKDVVRYSKLDAMFMLARHKHYGPWDPKFDKVASAISVDQAMARWRSGFAESRAISGGGEMAKGSLPMSPAAEALGW